MGPEGKASRRLGFRKRRVQAAEVRAGDATPFTGPAIVAGGAAPVLASEHRDPAHGEHPVPSEAPGKGLPHHVLGAVELHRRKELPVGKLRQPLLPPGDADEVLDVVVPGRNIFIAKRPVDGEAVPQVGFEVEVAPPVGVAAPHDGAPADLTAPDPCERFVGVVRVGVLAIVHEELARPLVAGVALPLNRLVLQESCPIAEPAKPHLPRGNVLHIVALGRDGTARFEDQRLESLLRELHRRVASGDPGADHDRIVDFLLDDRRHGLTCLEEGRSRRSFPGIRRTRAPAPSRLRK